MATTITPNMSLIVPTPGQEPGPMYATDINSSLTLIDQHNHSPGQGVPVTPAGLSISTDLSFIGNNATLLRSCRFSPQSGPLVGPSDLGCLYEQGVDLYYNDGSGNVVRITQGGSVAGASGSITGLVSPASVVFSALTGIFTFQSDTNVAGGMDFGPFTVRDVAASANGITINSPVALAANYSITLPGSTPGSTLPLTMDNSGNVAATAITGSMIGSNTIAAASIVNNSISDTQILPGSITGASLVGNIDLGGPNVTAGSRQIVTQGALSSPSNLILVRGRVDSAGSALAGEGWSSSTTGTGLYTVTYTFNFLATPATVVTCENAGAGRLATITASSNNAFSISIINPSSGSQANTAFDFIAIGLPL